MVRVVCWVAIAGLTTHPPLGPRCFRDSGRMLAVSRPDESEHIRLTLEGVYLISAASWNFLCLAYFVNSLPTRQLDQSKVSPEVFIVVLGALVALPLALGLAFCVTTCFDDAPEPFERSRSLPGRFVAGACMIGKYGRQIRLQHLLICSPTSLHCRSLDAWCICRQCSRTRRSRDFAVGYCAL